MSAWVLPLGAGAHSIASSGSCKCSSYGIPFPQRRQTRSCSDSPRSASSSVMVGSMPSRSHGQDPRLGPVGASIVAFCSVRYSSSAVSPIHHRRRDVSHHLGGGRPSPGQLTGGCRELTAGRYFCDGPRPTASIGRGKGALRQALTSVGLADRAAERPVRTQVRRSCSPGRPRGRPWPCRR